ncbi:MAG: RNA polymerase sigma factor [Victivallales bacterium]|nr:RNA polymerase sigma factor [Victivallales bacterium]
MSILSPYTEKHFEGIVREHLPFFRGMALRILKNAADADDAVQTALLKGWNRRFFIRSSEKMVGWLGRIVINESYNIFRKRQREAIVTTASLPDVATESETDSHEEQILKLETAIAKLPEIYRDTIHIAVLGELDAEEAARLLDCPVNTLYQRIHKAKQLLREALKDE